MSCTVVCISHATGAGGEEVGRQLAERLGFLYVDEEVVAGAAEKGGFSPDDVASEERRRSFARRLLDTLAQGGESWAPSGGAVLGDTEELRGLVRETIRQLAGRGRVVIVAHAASRALPQGPDVLRVLVTASPETRARRLTESDELDDKQAARTVKDADAGRRDYLKRFYGVDEELPTDYDLVVNTDTLSHEEAADLLARAASR
jgi:Cytidylate kinase-like family